MRHVLSGTILIAGIVGLADPSTAKVVKFEIVRVESPAFEGRRFAAVGTYELCDNNGSMIPFAATREERLQNNDPRLSMAERYPNQGDRAAAIAKAAQQLVQDRLLLEDDARLFAAGVN